jgi:hypothetical protein
VQCNTCVASQKLSLMLSCDARLCGSAFDAARSNEDSSWPPRQGARGALRACFTRRMSSLHCSVLCHSRVSIRHGPLVLTESASILRTWVIWPCVSNRCHCIPWERNAVVAVCEATAATRQHPKRPLPSEWVKCCGEGFRGSKVCGPAKLPLLRSSSSSQQSQQQHSQRCCCCTQSCLWHLSQWLRMCLDVRRLTNGR